MSIWSGYRAGLSDAEQTRGLADDVETTRNRDRLSRGQWTERRPWGTLRERRWRYTERSQGHHMALERGLVKAVRTGGNQRRIARADRSRHRSGPCDRVACSGKAHGLRSFRSRSRSPAACRHENQLERPIVLRQRDDEAITLQARLVALASRRRTRQELSTSIDLEPDFVIATPLYNDVPHLVLPYALRMSPEKAEAHRLRATPASECRAKPGHHRCASCSEKSHPLGAVFMTIFTISDAVPGCGARARSSAMADNCAAYSSTTFAMCRNARITPRTSP